MATFAQNLKILRGKRDLTQEGLAKELNSIGLSITPSAIGMWEQGRREPDYETLESLADFFNVDIDFLIGRTDYTTRLVGKDSILNAQVVREERAGYYTNPEVAKLAQEIYENPDLRILLDASRDVSKEDLELVAEMVKKLKKTNRD